MKRKICIITGTRADYGHLTPVMKAVAKTKGLDLQVVATGMHLMPEFGSTIKEIENDGFKVDAKVNASYKEDSGRAMAISVGKIVAGMSDAFSNLKPDVVIVLGDRGEMLAAAIAANYLNIPVAHLHGGEISGHIDGILRHAITKLAHLHFPATKGALERILRLGEEPWRVHVVGAPTLDKILNEKLPDEVVLRKKYGLDRNQPFALVAQHPVSTDIAIAGHQMSLTLDALESIGLRVLLLYPNADAGGRAMIKAIKQRENRSFLTTRKSIPHGDYLGLMKVASVLVGNSSSGIIEASSFGLPVVNIGSRQVGREKGANVLDVSPEKNAIKRSIEKALFDMQFRDSVRRGNNIYGDGHASERIIRVLKNIRLENVIMTKRMTY